MLNLICKMCIMLCGGGVFYCYAPYPLSLALTVVWVALVHAFFSAIEGVR